MRKPRYYKEGEAVWIVDEQKVGYIQTIDIPNLKAIVKVDTGLVGSSDDKLRELNFWEIDKLKYEAYEKVHNKNYEESEKKGKVKIFLDVNNLELPKGVTRRVRTTLNVLNDDLVIKPSEVDCNHWSCGLTVEAVYVVDGVVEVDIKATTKDARFIKGLSCRMLKDDVSILNVQATPIGTVFI